MNPLQVDITQREGAVVLTLSGPLTGRNVAALRRAAFDMEATACGHCLLDMNDVDEIDGYGLSALVGLLSRRREQHSRLALFGVSPDLRRCFEATFCDTLFPIRSTLSAAFDAVGLRQQDAS